MTGLPVPEVPMTLKSKLLNYPLKLAVNYCIK
jgi:hypothetical protein